MENKNEGNERMEEKVKVFAALVEKQTIEHLKANNLGCEANINNARVNIKTGKKYIKVDMGGSGKYMIDQDGNIYGIKAYGVINRGHHFGTLDTIAEYNWGGCRAVRCNKNVAWL